MRGAMTTVGELLLSRLHDLGVRHIFGLPGDYNMEFLDQIEAFPGIEWVGSCNELNAAYSADGYARLAGIAAIVTTFGPGELSAVCGLAGAMAESVPIVSIVGGPPVRIMEQHAAMHHSLADGDYDRWVRVGREVTVAQTSLTADNFHLPPATDVLLAPLWGAIGYATPAAFGAGMAEPARRVVLITGDGSLQLTVQEISRMLGTGQRPIIMVLNNGGYTVERAIEGPHQPYNDIDTWRYAELPTVFARNAPVDSHVVTTEGELARVFAGLSGRPDRLTIIEVRLDTEDVPAGMPRWGQETTALDYQVRMSMDPPRLPWGGLPEQTAS
ncbi:thiamine pyrophosphate-binding protein [Plantactinospora sp. CA-290183]|uniref:thiamine pyrophosphate-binding protein n=1 Tax=Plantactinospora sp. CA-290183 TaxID=3240006 RepID=UPI003D91D46B